MNCSRNLNRSRFRIMVRCEDERLSPQCYLKRDTSVQLSGILVITSAMILNEKKTAADLRHMEAAQRKRDRKSNNEK